MNPSRLFIERPVATSLLMLALLLSGLIALRLLPLAALPEVDYPTIEVKTFYPGASPEVTAATVTAPLERQFGQMAGLMQMTSSSSGGASVITLRFSLDLPLAVAEQAVQGAMNTAAKLLPDDLPMPPVYSKVNPADAPIMTLAITSPGLPAITVHELVENRLAPRLAQIDGVGLVSLGGGARPAVRIQADPLSLARLNLSLQDLRTAIAAANTNGAKGGFDGPERASTLDANGQLRAASDYAALIIAWREGRPVRLRDVATVVDDAENLRMSAWVGTTPGVVVNIQRQPGANVIQTVDRVRKLLPALVAVLPASVDVAVVADRTVTIRAAVRDTVVELLLAITLVVLINFVFLGNARATLIPGVVVPLSIVGTFGVMHLAGFSINNLTLMALVVSTGFVIDDAIVMIENIARHIERGKSAMQAALDGARQIAFTIISLTVSLLAVLIPLLFMSDVVGRLFREFAVTLAVAILLSAMISLTLTPMMCARLLDSSASLHGCAIGRRVARFFDHVVAAYGRGVVRVLDRPRLTLAGFALTAIATVVLYGWIPKGFFPQQDTGLIQVVTEARQASSFDAMAERQRALAGLVMQDPDVAHVASFIGVDGVNSTLNTGRMQISLKPFEERSASAADVIARLSGRIAALPGITAWMQPVQDLTIEDRVSRTRFQLLISSPDEQALVSANQRLLERLRQSAQLTGVASDRLNDGLQAFVDIDREAAGRLGVSVAAIDAALYDAYGQRLISTIYTQANQYRVVLEVAPRFRQGPLALNQLHVTATQAGPDGSTRTVQVPLSSVARFSERPVALAVNRVGQFPAATLSFDLAPGVALGQAVDEIRRVITELDLPASVETSFQGAAAAFTDSLGSTLLLILAAIVTMYIVLGVLYESTLHPLTILSTLPSAGLGALLALLVTRHDFGIVAVIGIVLLIGLVKKNAIIMIDFALDAQRRHGLTPRAAIEQACLLRFRPILMTTVAALLGALPLMLGSGAGHELRNPLGIVMVGGLIVSQLLTLFTTPVIYLTFARQAERLAHWREQRANRLPAGS